MKPDNAKRRARRSAAVRIGEPLPTPQTPEGLVAAAIAHAVNAVDLERRAGVDADRAGQWLQKAERERSRSSNMLELLEEGFRRGDQAQGSGGKHEG